MSTTWKRLAEISIAALIVINIFELAFFFKVRHDAKLYDSRTIFPLPGGYLLDKTFVSARAARCYLIRVSSDACPYCKLDQGQYAQLVHHAQSSGCDTFIVAPKTGQIKANGNDGGVKQLQYVDMKFGQVLNPYMTPETILLDEAGRILWDREGSMDNTALSNALRTLGKLR